MFLILNRFVNATVRSDGIYAFETTEICVNEDKIIAIESIDVFTGEDDEGVVGGRLFLEGGLQIVIEESAFKFLENYSKNLRR